MKVHFLREGYANNSSSSHSIIFSGQKNTKDVREIFESDYGFGWDQFVIKSQYVKFVYAMNSVFDFISRNHSASYLSYDRGWYDIANATTLAKEFDDKLIEAYFAEGTFIHELDEISSGSKFLTRYFEDRKTDDRTYRHTDGLGYVDHQSLISLPRLRDGKKMNKRFAVCMIKEIVEQNYLILGGNDNNKSSHKADYNKYISSGKEDLLNCLTFLKDNHTMIMSKYDDVAGHFVISSKKGPIMFASFADNLVNSKLEG